MGRCPVGATLPTIRIIAAGLGVNYHTVRRAYDLLVADGVVESRRGGGTVVLRVPRSESRQATAVSVVECNLTDATELARDAEARYRITARPWLLEWGEPSPGVILGTWFHAAEIRKRWPRRAGDLFLVDREPDPRLADVVRAAVGASGATGLVLVEQDRGTGRRMGAEVRPLLAPLGRPLRVVAPRDPGRVLAEVEGAVVLYAPRVWDTLAWESRSHVRACLVRFRACHDSLHRAARPLGWPLRVHPREG